jgi:cell division protein FtsL
MTLIPEYIIVMTWALAAVIIVAIITAIFFRLYIMLLSNEKENLRDRISDYDYQIGSARNRLEKLKEEIKVLEKKKNGNNN